MSEIVRTRAPVGSTVAARMDYWTEVDGHCWAWKGSRNSAGYGRVRAYGRQEYAHRVAWQLFTGEPIPEGLFVNHLCGRRDCVRPQHLSLATPAENAQFQTTLSVANTSGYRGVTWRAAKNKWEAHAALSGVKYFFGLHDTAEEANLAAIEGRRQLHGIPEFADVAAQLFR